MQTLCGRAQLITIDQLIFWLFIMVLAYERTSSFMLGQNRTNLTWESGHMWSSHTVIFKAKCAITHYRVLHKFTSHLKGVLLFGHISQKWCKLIPFFNLSKNEYFLNNSRENKNDSQFFSLENKLSPKCETWQSIICLQRSLHSITHYLRRCPSL